jgi:hypothetical protein
LGFGKEGLGEPGQGFGGRVGGQFLVANVSSLVWQNNPFWCGRWTCHMWQVELPRVAGGAAMCGRWSCHVWQVGPATCGRWTQSATPPGPKPPHPTPQFATAPGPHPNLPDLQHLNLHPHHISTKPQPGLNLAYLPHPKVSFTSTQLAHPPFPRSKFSK